MSNILLDMRLSVHSNASDGDTELTNTPLLIGDIGLQTTGAAPFNLNHVRALLTGTVGVTKVYDPDIVVDRLLRDVPPGTTIIRITIERGGTDVAGTGTVILEEVVDVAALQLTIAPLSVSAGDFPPAAAVATGQVRYTMFISVNNPLYSYRFFLSGPVVFNGIAAAGTT